MKQVKAISWAAALCLVGAGAYAVAQPKTGQGKACSHECPMHQAAELSDIKLESTKQGATIVLVAKRAEDIAKVQESARQIAAMLSGQECPEHAGRGGMHHHGHQQPAQNPK